MTQRAPHPIPPRPFFIAGAIALLPSLGWAQEATPRTNPLNLVAVVVVVLVAALLLLGLAFFLRRLQVEGSALVRQADMTAERLAAWREMQAGLPDGSIRAALSIFIVAVGMLALLTSTWIGLPSTGEIGTIIGSVLGFYFGARQAGGDASGTLARTVGDLTADNRSQRTAADTATARAVDAEARAATAPAQVAAAAEATGFLSRATDLLEIARLGAQVAIPLLGATPRTTAAVAAIDDGLAAARGAAAGDPAAMASAAGAAAHALDAAFGPDHPLAAVLGDALGGLRGGLSAAPLLGAALGGPPGLLVAVGLGAIQALSAGHESYERWKARVLDRPFTPALFPPGAMDAAVLLSALDSSGAFARAFLVPVPAEARLPRARAVADAARLDDAAARTALLALAPRQDFASDDAFSVGLHAYRKRLLDALPGPDIAIDLGPVLGAGAPRVAGTALGDALASARALPGGSGLDAAVMALLGLAAQPDTTPARMAALLTRLLPVAETIAATRS
ncbi:hypothetical protein ACQW02_00760 [Humitalea sp. 24SJ18S-53]|uniref:hypothetical protein n=1 Tax=Humitalea sp. 24SJ18S-53 TaxID=3422307 RepID=UPI003D6664C9